MYERFCPRMNPRLICRRRSPGGRDSRPVRRPVVVSQRSVLPKRIVLCVIRYSIERLSDPEKFFYIDITSGSLMTVRSLDREKIGWHNVTVLAMEMSM